MSPPEKMKAALLTELRKIELDQVATPQIRHPEEVLLKTEVVGVCGSDVHYYTTGRIGDQIVSYPYRVGHEFAAQVLETGKSVQTLRPGDRVAVDPAMPCGHCQECRSGRAHTCYNLRFLGCPGQASGCLSEYIVMPAECCFPIPEGMSLEEAAIVEPLSIGIYAVRLSGAARGKRAAILGCGPIGLSVLLPLLDQQAESVFVTDKIDRRLEMARKGGAHWTGNPLQQDVVQEILEREPGGLDLVFECCGQQEALDQGIELLKPGGKLMIIGIPETDRVSFDVDGMRRKEIAIQNVRRQNDCMQTAIDFIAARNDVQFMITHRFNLEQCAEAFELVANYRDGVMKAMIHP